MHTNAPNPSTTSPSGFGELANSLRLCQWSGRWNLRVDSLRGLGGVAFNPELLENPGIPLPFRIQTISLKVLDLKFKVLDTII
jgi:hypothetical protein